MPAPRRETEPQTRRTAGRRVLRALAWSAAAAVLAAGFVALARHSTSWFGEGVVSSLAKRAAAVVSFPGAPGYMRHQKLAGADRTIVIAAWTGVGWFFGVLGLCVLLGIRRWFLALPTRRSSWLPPKSPTPDTEPPADEPRVRGISRRRLLADGLFLGAAAPAIGVPTYAAAVAPGRLHVRRWRVPIDRLPAGLDSLRIAHLSDLHQGAMMPAAYIRAAVERALSLDPDIVLLTGDYVDRDGGDPAAAAALLEPLADRSRVPLGVLAVLGNHDWYVGGEAVRHAIAAVGIRPIDHTRVMLHGPSRAVVERSEALPADSGAWLAIGGVGDVWEDHADAQLAFGDLADDVPRLLLMHNPDAIFFREFRATVGDRYPDLILAGHTHGGQVRVPLIGNPYMPPHYSSDEFSHRFGDTRIGRMIVSHGVGVTIMPVRFGVPPEIGLIELTRGPGEAVMLG